GIELVEDRRTKVPAKNATSRVMELARDLGLLIGKGGTYGNVLRCTPPMNITKTDVDEFADKLNKAMAAWSAETNG
ncbi:MAG: aspartate aminotransferase family protein, partial [Acidobacteria bacterium]|nr:aspartate aminotransferase family protein [Acidobacteriota bacterium]